MRTNNKRLKQIIQTLLVFVIFIQIGPKDIRNDFYDMIHNTTLFFAIVIVLVFVFKFIVNLFLKSLHLVATKK